MRSSILIPLLLASIIAGASAIVKTETNQSKIENINDNIKDIKEDLRWIRNYLQTSKQ